MGDIEGNADRVLSWARHAADQGAHVVAFPEMVLTGYPVEDLALRRSFVRASRAALDDLAQRLAADGLGELLVVVGYLDGAADAVPVLGTPAGAPQNAAGLLYGGTRGRPLRQAPPAQLRGVRRVPLLRARRVPDRRARARRGRRDRHLRGHLAGGWPGRGHPRSRRRPPAGHQRVALRAQQGRRPSRPGPPPGGRGRLHARLREHGRRSGRARLRRRLDRGRPGRHRSRPRPAVRRGLPGRRPRPAGRHRGRRRPGELRGERRPQRHHHHARDAHRAARRGLRARRRGDRATARRRGRGLRRPGDRAARLRRQERLRQRRARPLRRHRLGPHRGDRVRRPRCRQRARHLDAQRLLLGALAIRRGRPRASAPACSSRPCRSSRWSTPTSASSS